MSQLKEKILLVEDDQVLGYAIKDFLQKQNFEVCHCLDAHEAWVTFMKGKFNMCLLDVTLPGKNNGLMLAKNIREKNIDIPIIIVSSKTDSEDVLSGFENGADDYITKPFNFQELVFRMNVFLKRSIKEKDERKDPVRIGDLLFDYENFTLVDDGNEYILTKREADLINYLCQNPNRLIRREDILSAIWGQDDFFFGRSMDVFINKIRKYLKSQTKVRLETIRGIGFKFRDNIQVAALTESQYH